MRTVDDILNKIKLLKGIKTDTELAVLFNVKPNTVTNWRKRQSIPYDSIVTLCEKEDWPIGAVIAGQITTKEIEVDGQMVLTIAKEPGLYKKEPAEADRVPEKTALYNNVRGDAEMEEIIDILQKDLPEAKGTVLKILKCRKGLKEAFKELWEIEKPIKEA